SLVDSGDRDDVGFKASTLLLPTGFCIELLMAVQGMLEEAHSCKHAMTTNHASDDSQRSQ
ncbi:hypothetical protein BX616_005250, partial [Lobosporangium transversale]